MAAVGVGGAVGLGFGIAALSALGAFAVPIVLVTVWLGAWAGALAHGSLSDVEPPPRAERAVGRAAPQQPAKQADQLLGEGPEPPPSAPQVVDGQPPSDPLLGCRAALLYLLPLPVFPLVLFTSTNPHLRFHSVLSFASLLHAVALPAGLIGLAVWWDNDMAVVVMSIAGPLNFILGLFMHFGLMSSALAAPGDAELALQQEFPEGEYPLLGGWNAFVARVGNSRRPSYLGRLAAWTVDHWPGSPPSRDSAARGGE
jgi:hypothetical protein